MKAVYVYVRCRVKRSQAVSLAASFRHRAPEGSVLTLKDKVSGQATSCRALGKI